VIEVVKTYSDKVPRPGVSSVRLGLAYRCTACGGIWMKRGQAERHACPNGKDHAHSDR